MGVAAASSAPLLPTAVSEAKLTLCGISSGPAVPDVHDASINSGQWTFLRTHNEFSLIAVDALIVKFQSQFFFF